MFNPTAAAPAFGDHLAETCLHYFAGRKPDYAAHINGCARMMLERLGNPDALYHNAEHTTMVTLAGQQILRGQLVTRSVQPEDGRQSIVALLIHDTGYPNFSLRRSFGPRAEDRHRIALGEFACCRAGRRKASPSTAPAARW